MARASQSARPAAPPAGDERIVELTRRLAGVLSELGLSEVEIESKVGGRIAKVLVENGQAVEYGQPLFLIDPQG